MLPIATELLEIEHERLLGDHYDTPAPEGGSRFWKDNRPCDGCERAMAVRLELESITAACKGCGDPMNVIVRGHHHTENGKDVT